MWHLGEAGQTCNEVCGALGAQCTAESRAKQTALTFENSENEAVSVAAFNKAGSGCTSIKQSYAYAGAPFMDNRGSCYAVGTRNGGTLKRGGTSIYHSVCDVNKIGHHKPLCYCEMLKRQMECQQRGPW